MEDAPTLDEVLALLPLPPWTAADLGQMSYRLEAILPQIDASPMRASQESIGRAALEKAMRGRRLQCLPACVAAVVAASGATQ